MNLLVIDMLEGFTRKGALSSPRVAALIPKQVEFLKRIPENSYVIFAADAHYKGDAELQRMPVHCMAGSEEGQICGELLHVVLDRRLTWDVVCKTTHSAFFETDMEAVMKRSEAHTGSNEWVVFGCVTDICITANVMELAYRGRPTTVVRDLVDTYEITREVATDILKDPAKAHDPEVFNHLFLDYYLPGVWGAKIQTAEDTLRK